MQVSTVDNLWITFLKKMAKVVDLDIDPSLKDLMLKGVNVKDRKTQINIEKKDIVWRKRNLKVVEDRTTLDQISALWNALTSVQQSAWDTAAAYSGMRGYDLFVQDTSYRIQNGISGVATPNNNYQFMVLKTGTDDYRDVLGGTQHHFSSQNVRKYRAGSKLAFDWVLQEEVFAPPLLVEFDYYSDLVDQPSYYFWRLICRFWGTKDGSPADDEIDFDLDLQTGWQRFSEELNPDLDEIDRYYITIYGYRVEGVAYFDNFNFEHDGSNFAFDPQCNRVYEKDVLASGSLDYNWDYNVSPDTMHPRSFYLQ